MAIAIPSDTDRVLLSAVEHLKRSDEGRLLLARALRQASWGFEDNAHEYAQTGAFDVDEQLTLSRLAADQAAALEAEPAPWNPADGIPF